MEGFRGLLLVVLYASSVFGATYLSDQTAAFDESGQLRAARPRMIPKSGLQHVKVKGNRNRKRAAVSPVSPPVDPRQAAVAALITDEVNRLRRIPPASNMYKMAWDTDIQTTAQTLANKCKYQHSNPADKTTRYTSLGQNIAMTSGSSGAMSWNATIKMWYDEVNDFIYNKGPKTPNAVVGHYTALVWAASNAIGCAYAQCASFFLYVCNFGPAGNMMSSLYTPYAQGTRCSACPKGSTCDNDLCSTPPPPAPKTCQYTNKYSNCGTDVPGSKALFPASDLPATPNGCATVPAYLAPYASACAATCNCPAGSY